MAYETLILRLWIVLMIASLLVTSLLTRSADAFPLAIGYASGITLGVLFARVLPAPPEQASDTTP